MSGFLPSLGRCWLFLLVLIVGSHGAITRDITRTFRLDQVANEIQTSGDTEVYQANFEAYNDIGRLRITSAKAATIIFTRKTPTDSVIRVGTEALFDIKGVTSTIVLRNLAFNLINPNSILLSGADAGAPNRNLILDSCFIFSDYSNNRFLSWIADTSGVITIRNSFLVTRFGVAWISLEGKVVELKNNNFNYAGYIQTSTRERLVADNNTFNRTQLSANGQLFSSDFIISDNLFAFPSKHNALGIAGAGEKPYPILLQAFSATKPNTAFKNKLYENVWAGFHPQPPNRFTEDASNQVIRAYASPKDTSELWNWYIHEEDTAGFHNIEGKPVPQPYNVFPSDSTFLDTLDGKPLTFAIQRSTIPRRADAKFDGNLLGTYSDTLRPIWPDLPGITLGKKSTFSVRSLTIHKQEPLGSPALLAYTGGRYLAPAPGVPAVDTTIRFQNSQPTAASFHPAFYVNMPRGARRSPTDLSNGDTLNIDSVSFAGPLQWLTVAKPSLPQNFRNLRFLRYFGFVTKAKLQSDSMLIGTTLQDSIQPYDPSRVYWLVKGDTNLVNATTQGRRQTARVAVPEDSIFEATLVEKLSARRGVDTQSVAGALVRTVSDSGFQLEVDTDPAPNPRLYGDATPGFRFSWKGRKTADSVSLILDPDVEGSPFKRKVYRLVAGTISPALPVRTEDGNLVVSIGMAESGHTYFAAIEHNILADAEKTGPVEGVLQVIDFHSSVSGVLTFQPLQADVLQQPFQNASVFRDTRFLAGRDIRAYKVIATRPYSLVFEAPGVAPSDTLAVYYLAAQSWNSLTTFTHDAANGVLRLDGIPPEAEKVVAVKKQPAIADVVSAQPHKIQGNNLAIMAEYRNGPSDRITGYCLQVRDVDTFGDMRDTCSSQASIGAAVSWPLVPNHVYQYRLRYFDSEGEYGVPQAFTTLSEFTWNPVTVRKPDGTRQANKLHLVGFPYAGTIGQSLRRSTLPPDSTIADVDLVLSLYSNDKGKPAFDTLVKPLPELGTDLQTVRPGQALLVASARSYELHLDANLKFPALEPRKLPLDSGWKFISSPYPVNFSLSRIEGFRRSEPRFFKLVRDSLSAGGYQWERGTLLQAFVGYVYYHADPETLTFDLFRKPEADAMPKASATPGEGLLRARLETVVGSSTMWLSTYRREAPTPFLPVPGAGVEMRIGGGSGFLIKPVADGMALDEPVLIRASRATRARFSLAPSEGSVGTVPEVRLLDLATGAIHDPASGESLELAEGNNAYRLVAGRSDFVAARARTFRAGLPAAMTLSQNHPNPFRGLTRIALDWPASDARRRTATLEVLDMAGRRIWSRDFRDIRAGRETVSLDAGRWRSGVYLYRLTVRTGARRSVLEKKMVVLP